MEKEARDAAGRAAAEAQKLADGTRQRRTKEKLLEKFKLDEKKKKDDEEKKKKEEDEEKKKKDEEAMEQRRLELLRTWK